MKRALACMVALTLLAGSAWGADRDWPGDMAEIEALVTSLVGEISYDRVKVRRDGDAIDVAIKLKNVPRQFRQTLQSRADDDDVFLATNIVDTFEPDLDFPQGYDLTPNDLLDYYFGFGVFNFGSRIKREASIRVFGADGDEFQNTKKKYKLRKNRVQLRFLERGVSGPGLYGLETVVGPWSLVTYFCASCG